jgi:hypothetical protein
MALSSSGGQLVRTRLGFRSSLKSDIKCRVYHLRKPGNQRRVKFQKRPLASEEGFDSTPQTPIAAANEPLQLLAGPGLWDEMTRYIVLYLLLHKYNLRASQVVRSPISMHHVLKSTPPISTSALNATMCRVSNRIATWSGNCEGAQVSTRFF